jgi:hypothetical protein
VRDERLPEEHSGGGRREAGGERRPATPLATLALRAGERVRRQGDADGEERAARDAAHRARGAPGRGLRDAGQRARQGDPRAGEDAERHDDAGGHETRRKGDAQPREQDHERRARRHARRRIRCRGLPQQVVDAERHAEQRLEQRQQGAGEDAGTEGTGHRRPVDDEHQRRGTGGGDAEGLVERDVVPELREDGRRHPPADHREHADDQGDAASHDDEEGRRPDASISEPRVGGHGVCWVRKYTGCRRAVIRRPRGCAP